MGIIITEGMQDRYQPERRFVLPWGGAGPKSPIWVKNQAMIKKFVQKLKIQPAAEAALAGYHEVSGDGGARASALMRRPIPGGIRVPHLHLDGKVFLLDDKQWNDFSGRVMKEYRAKLEQVNSVSFEQVMGLSEVLDPLPAGEGMVRTR